MSRRGRLIFETAIAVSWKDELFGNTLLCSGEAVVAGGTGLKQ